MSTLATPVQAPADQLAAGAGCYLYGIVPASAAPVAPGGGAAGPEHRATLVPYGRIAGLVRTPLTGPVRPTRPELLGHAGLLDQLAATVPVLPMRFGTVLGSPAAVTREVLEPNHDAYAAALAALAGRAQFMVAARYHEEAVLREVLAERPAVLHLRHRLRLAGGADPAGRVRLGELVARAIARKRAADAAVLTAALRPHSVAGRLLEPRSSGLVGIGEAVLLVELGHREQLAAAAEQLARRWHGRVRLRLRGPMAAYHFVAGLVDPTRQRR
jgi:hypothetical protein